MELLFHFTDPLTNVVKTCRINGQQLFNFAPATNQSTHPATVGVRCAPLSKLFCMFHKCWRLASFMRGTELGGAGIYKTSLGYKKAQDSKQQRDRVWQPLYDTATACAGCTKAEAVYLSYRL